MKNIIIISLSILTYLAVGNTAHAESNLERSKADITRDQASKPTEILDFLGVKKGDHVLDFLGGNGYYSIQLQNKVGSEGKVVLHNNQAYIQFVEKGLNERKAKGELEQVTLLLSEADDLKFGINKFDSAILVLGYHDFFHTDKGWDFPSDIVIPQLLKSLKKDGKLLVIDHAAAKGMGKSGTKSLHRIEGEFVKQELLMRGFKFIKESPLLRNAEDPLDIIVFAPEIRRKTDRFVYLFEKK